MKVKVNVKYYRELKKLTQKELASKAKISQSYVYEIEKGIKTPSLGTLEKIGNALDICASLLIAQENAENCNKCPRFKFNIRKIVLRKK